MEEGDGEKKQQGKEWEGNREGGKVGRRGREGRKEGGREGGEGSEGGMKGRREGVLQGEEGRFLGTLGRIRISRNTLKNLV